MVQPLHLVAKVSSRNSYSYAVTLPFIPVENVDPFFILIGIILILCTIFLSFRILILLGLALTTMYFVAPTFQCFLMLSFSGFVLILSFPYIDSYIPAR